MCDRIYMDHAATTPMDPEVLEVMRSVASARYGNASSVYLEGRKSREIVAHAREQVAALLHAQAEEIYFTSGGTESDNWVIQGIAKKSPRGRILVSAIEHPAIRRTAMAMAEADVPVTFLPTLADGRVAVDALEAALSEAVSLVSVMWANNETGVLQPIGEIASLCRARGIPMHSDAVQACGTVAVDVRDTVDYLSLSGHKLYGPRGIGALYMRKGRELPPLLYGGHQQDGLRPGTENLQAIAGLGKACEIAQIHMEERAAHMLVLRERLLAGLRAGIPDLCVFGSLTSRLPGNLAVAIPGLRSESLLLQLDLEGIAASGGSACNSGSMEPSHVLTAMGIAPSLALDMVRLTLGKDTTQEEIDRVISVMTALAGQRA
ncbi:MAG: cysteine desulfurase [Clostridia bacterium]|nr:cysteine desulfurase [Clostridia bacterium]